MGILRLQHAMQDDSGLPEDQYVNTFYFITAGTPDVTDGNSAAALIEGFYTSAVGGPSTPASYLSQQLDGNVLMKTYDMAHPMPRTPITEHATFYSVGAGAGKGLPAEVAVCLSYSAAPVVGIPPARLRGRIYFGPLDDEASQSGTDNHVLVNPVLMSRLTDGAENMAGAATLVNLTWAMYSPTRVAASPIVKVHVDNAFDTQRRRGNQATSRTTVVF